jgi:hypothetical protein
MTVYLPAIQMAMDEIVAIFSEKIATCSEISCYISGESASLIGSSHGSIMLARKERVSG